MTCSTSIICDPKTLRTIWFWDVFGENVAPNEALGNVTNIVPCMSCFSKQFRAKGVSGCSLFRNFELPTPTPVVLTGSFAHFVELVFWQQFRSKCVFEQICFWFFFGFGHFPLKGNLAGKNPFGSSKTLCMLFFFPHGSLTKWTLPLAKAPIY